MRKWAYEKWAKLLTVIGDIKVFKWPFWMVYDPKCFEVTGDEVMKILKLLKPGDIILRGYNWYLDGKFIPDKLKFSHGALYVGNGKIIHAIAEGVSETNVVEFA